MKPSPFKHLFVLLPLCLQAQFSIEKMDAPESVGLSSFALSQMTDSLHLLVENQQLAGIQTAVIREGKLVHFDSYGYANLEKQIPLNEQSIFRIFSMTKPLVSVALMQLYEKGLFQLEDPVSKFIPAFKNAKVYTENGLVPAAKPIQIIDLLTHSSGLNYGRSIPEELADYYRQANLYSAEDNQAFALKAAGLPLEFEPGSDWRYGISTTVIGYLIEVLSGQTLDQYLEEHILSPLEMHDTHFQLPLSKVDRFTVGYRWSEQNGLFVSEDQYNNRYTRKVTLFNGGGGLVSTSLDYLNFCQMLLNGGRFKGKQLLQQSTVDLMLQDHLEEQRNLQGRLRLPPHEYGFGLGFAVKDPGAPGGIYGWGGAVGTYFKIDTRSNMAYVMMIQLSPYRHLELRERFHHFVQAAIAE